MLEQLFANGESHPFASTMMSHFHKLGTPLGAIRKYPTTADQQSRFKVLGWPEVSVSNLWKIWSSDKFVTADDHKFLDSIEPFDEWEEFALFGCHYVLAIADTVAQDVMNSNSRSDSIYPIPKWTVPKAPNLSFTEHPKGQGCRRFAAVIPVVGQQRAVDDIGLFGGMGLMTRLSSYDVYTNSTQDAQDRSSRSAATPSSRMCHTITDLQEGGALLIGGRTSPDTGLADCWLYHKWLDTWERVEDLPWPLYRHQAVHLGCGSVLVSTGRISSRVISTDYLLWNRKTGWRKCAYAEGEIPIPTYGATFANISGFRKQSPRAVSGLLSGGMTGDSYIQQISWTWEIDLSHDSESPPVIKFQHLGYSKPRVEISRFGASVVEHQGKTYVVGGIIRDEIILKPSEISTVEILDGSLVCSGVGLRLCSGCPRPLLVGATAVSTKQGLLIVGGSAVCFSFGTYLNKGCFTLLPDANSKASTSWKYFRTVEPSSYQEPPKTLQLESSCSQANIELLPRVCISSSADFEKLVQTGLPVILEGLDIGSCTTKWTAQYLKDKIGVDRQVSFSYIKAAAINK